MNDEFNNNLTKDVSMETNLNVVLDDKTFNDLSTAFNISADNEFPVNGRILHKKLGVGKDFSNWSKKRIKGANLVEGKDYIIVRNENTFSTENPEIKLRPFGCSDKSSYLVANENPEINLSEISDNNKSDNWSRQKIDYFYTINAAKHIAMMEKTEKGYLVRSYFIKCEEMLKSVNPFDNSSGIYVPDFNNAIEMAENWIKNQKTIHKLNNELSVAN
mgnify:CR=1 FL=1